MGKSLSKTITSKHQRRYKMMYSLRDIESAEHFLELDSFKRHPTETLTDSVDRLTKLIAANIDYITPENRKTMEEHLLKSSIHKVLKIEHVLMLEKLRERKRRGIQQKMDADTLLKEAMILEARWLKN